MKAASAESTSLAADPGEGRDAFPYAYARSFLEFLRQQQPLIRTITYADLDFAAGDTHTDHYAAEFARWNQRVAATPWMRRTIFVLLQHDVDFLPGHTMRMAADQARLGLRSNLMLFHRRIDRRRLQADDVVQEADYPLDWEQLRRLQASGFVLGYHSNAYEWSGFDRVKAAEVFCADLQALRQQADFRFFSPHGGVRDANGESNNILEVPSAVANSVHWVHNRFGLRFHGQFSDGGVYGAKRELEALDLISFVRHWRAGRRYRVLLHPQYYGDPVRRVPRLSGVEWYERALAADAPPESVGHPWRLARTAVPRWRAWLWRKMTAAHD
jgi:hypothetical protein